MNLYASDAKYFAAAMDAVDWLPIFGPHRPGLHATHIGFARVTRHRLRVYRLSSGARVWDADDAAALAEMRMGLEP